jgi:hypothetical protein
MAEGIGLTDGNIIYQHSCTQQSKRHITPCWALERPNLDAMLIIKGRLTRDFQLFHESVSPAPLSILLGEFQIFMKIHGQ